MIRICICGNSGHAGTIFETLSVRKDLQITAWCRSYKEENMEAFCTRLETFGMSAKEYEDYATMIQQEKPDIVVIDSIYSKHASLAALALQQNIHVYCDKPLALTWADLDLLKQTASASNGCLWAMQTARFDPWFFTAADLIRKGRIGSPRLYQIQKSYRYGQRPDFYRSRTLHGGLIPWVAIHGIDLLCSLSDEKVQTVYAHHSCCSQRPETGELELSAQLMLTLSDGSSAQISADYLRPETAPTHGDDRLRAAGTQGIIEVYDNCVFLSDEHGYRRQIPLLKTPLIFDEFIRTAFHSENSHILNTAESLRLTELALLARDAADQAHPIQL